MAVFFIFATLLGVVLQISNAWASEFMRSFETNYPNSFAVTNSNTFIALSQVSETLFILTIPFFLKRFGIKTVMIMSMLAWFFRFGLFGIGSPEGIGAGYLIMSMVVYGAAFDFFNISGSLFIEIETDSKYRGSAQGLFILLTNGVGAVLGGMGSGYIVQKYSVYDGINLVSRNWEAIWLIFSTYALVLAILFTLIFKYRHNPDKIKVVKH